MQNPTTGLTDISNLPVDRVKPTEGKFEQSASQSSTMQSVDHENIQREQMPQGSLEHLNAEPSLISQGVEAVKEFAHKAVEKIEEFVNNTAEKLHSLGGDKSTTTSELKKEVTKRTYLVKKSASRKLGKRAERLEKKAGLATGMGKVYAKEEYKNLRRKANRYGKELRRDLELTKRSLKEGGKDLEGKAKRFQRDFSKDGSVMGAQLREGARNLRREARRIFNEIPLLAKPTETKTTTKYTGDFSDVSNTKFLLDFSANEMNGRTGEYRSRRPVKSTGFEGDFTGKPTTFRMEVSAHDWNESVSTANRYAGMLMDMARSYMTRASKQGHSAQRRIRRESRNLKRTVERSL